ncbi:hypothetical protein [Nonomuraea endophytica]|uniref:hypothetical protein n=1 Tax=Nonomuraea endophytica TaxID=714136 RepID=UPI0037C8B2F0
MRLQEGGNLGIVGQPGLRPLRFQRDQNRIDPLRESSAARSHSPTVLAIDHGGGRAFTPLAARGHHAG